MAIEYMHEMKLSGQYVHSTKLKKKTSENIVLDIYTSLAFGIPALAL